MTENAFFLSQPLSKLEVSEINKLTQNMTKVIRPLRQQTINANMEALVENSGLKVQWFSRAGNMNFEMLCEE